MSRWETFPEVRTVPESELPESVAKKFAEVRQKWNKERNSFETESSFEILKTGVQSYPIILDAVQIDGLMLHYVKPETWESISDKDGYQISRAAVKQNGMALQYVSPSFLKKLEKYYLINIYTEAINSCGLAIQFINYDILKKSKLEIFDLYTMAINNNIEALQFLTKVSREEYEELAWEGLTKTPMAIRYISEPTVEMAVYSVKIDGNLIQYISHKFINEYILYQAVKQNGLALRYIDYKLQNVNLCITALEQNIEASKYVNPKMVLEALNYLADWKN